MLFDIIRSKERVEYNTAIKKMRDYILPISTGMIKPILWLLEHETVYSAGTSFDNQHVKSNQVNIINTGRGGSVTVHSPGQRIMYIMFPIKKYDISIGDFVNMLEHSLIQTINNLGGDNVHTSHGNRGVWINAKKIAFIGIHVSKGVTYHGVALNVCNDLSYYNCIDTCGLQDDITSLSAQGIKCNMHDVDNYLIDNIHNNLLLLI